MKVKCPHCGTWYEIEENDPDVWLEPWPHIVCEECGEWIPLFQKSVKKCTNCGRTYSSQDSLQVRLYGKTHEIRSIDIAGQKFESLCKDCLRIAIKSAALVRGESEVVIPLD